LTPAAHTADHRPRRAFLLPAVALCALSLFLASKVWFISQHANPTPYWDQWDAEAANLYKPWLEGKLSPEMLTSPHNEHRMLTTRIFLLALLEWNNGRWSPVMQMYANALLHLAAIAVFLSFACWALPKPLRVPMWIFGGCFLSVPFGWDSTIQGFNTHFYTFLLFSVCLLWSCSSDRLSRGKILGCAFLAVLLVFTMASGALSIVAACAVLLARRLLLGDSGIRLLPIVSLLAIALLAIAYTPHIPNHGHLKAQSAWHFFDSLLMIWGWPITTENSPLLGRAMAAVLLQLPLVLALAACFTGTIHDKRQRNYLLAMTVWLGLQTSALSYGRNIDVLSSRYLDTISLGLAAGFASWLILWANCGKAGRQRIAAAACLWVAALCIGVAGLINPTMAKIREKIAISRLQEANVRNYLQSRDPKWLRAAKFHEIPYPSAERLQQLLDDPSIQSFLPTDLLKQQAL
jgi:hypothetical protein